MRAILTLAVALAAFSAAPAFASAENCEAAPAKLRAIAATVDADAAKKAERNIALGEALCDARNRPEAAKKFNLAAKSLGTDLASVMTTTASANVQ
jgi:hypothetical protein